MNEAVEGFFRSHKKLTYKKGEMFIRPHDLSRNVYFLVAGYVRQFAVSEDGEEFTLIIFKPGDIFPLSFSTNSIKRNYFFEAINNTEVYISAEKEFYSKINELKINEYISKEIVNRFYGVIERMEHMAFGNASSKIASIIQICGQRFGTTTKEGITIHVPLTHRLVASLVGMSRETTSIEIKKLEREKIITFSSSRKIVILRKTALSNRTFYRG